LSNKRKIGKVCESGKERTLFSCVLFDKVLCSFRVNDEDYFMHRCYRCREYERFMREMQKEDERVMQEIDNIRKYGYPERSG